MIRSVKIPIYYAGFKARLETKSGHAVDDTISRILFPLMLAILYSSLLACIFFGISCPDRLRAVEKGNGGTEDTWVYNDAVIDLSNSFSCYIRSLHFILQVKSLVL